MLQLTAITKTYRTGDLKQVALNEVSVNFRESEFVAVLGPSGSGKTTLLNIIGGLDRYESGDLVIRGKSTKEYKDADWDAYRNHSVGFVFQSYNLIPHQSILANVELALTLSGVSKAERKKRARDVLDKVGLGDQLHKKPNQMSGGQMQRVAIARALVNNPDILLADEPTGALDSETSVQVIDLLKEISENKLVIMVTHNAELAEHYATRVIKLKDGVITEDSNPYGSGEAAQVFTGADKPAKKTRQKTVKTRMSLFTALSLSLNNLLTKKWRTFLTSFAGSIGIIGIALILSLSSGFQAYIDSVQEDTLSSYPLILERTAMDYGELTADGHETGKDKKTAGRKSGKIYSNTALSDRFNTMTEKSWNNNLAAFKAHLDNSRDKLQGTVNAVEYTYDVPLNIFSPDTTEGPKRLNPSPLEGMGSDSGGIQLFSSGDVWDELMDNPKLLGSQYDVIAGSWPKAYNEIVLIVDENDEINEQTLAALGLIDAEEMLAAMENNERYRAKKPEFTYKDILALRFRLVLQPDFYRYDDASRAWVDMSEDEQYVAGLIGKAVEMKITGVVRPSERAVKQSVSGGKIGYLKTLTEYVIKETAKREIVKRQIANPRVDIFTGLPFKETAEQKTTEESTTQPAATAAPATTAAAATVTPVSAPAAGSLSLKGSPPLSASFVETTTAPATMTEEEVYAYIDAHFKGEERDKMKDMAKLFLKDTRNGAERRRLIGYLNEMLKEQEVEGMGEVTGEQLYYYIIRIDKNTKLQMLAALIKSGGKPPETTKPNKESTTKPQEKPEQTTAKPKPGETTTVTQPDGQTPEEEPETAPTVSDASYKENLALLGVADIENPETILIYPKNFAAKDRLVDFIKSYNDKVTKEGKKENAIEYTDFIGLIMSFVTKIINIVSYVLIAFVSISLVVSSIMIGIITYISVLERTKEIGILRSIGASKRDISRVFNAETLIEGFAAGLIGIAATVALCIPVNMIIERLSDIPGVAKLPVAGGAALIVISILLTTLAGLIPSKMAAKKDPVVALRTE